MKYLISEFGVSIPMNKFVFIFLPSVAAFLRRMGVFSVAFTFLCGCEPDYSTSSGAVRDAIAEFESFKAYQPLQVVFLPLSEVYISAKPTEPDTIMAYVALQDGAGSAIKAPASFRFELYHFKPRSADPKGRRLHMWEDISLNDFTENNEYWRDYLRAYEFRLQYNCRSECRRYVLEVTCTCPSGARLLATTILDRK